MPSNQRCDVHNGVKKKLIEAKVGLKKCELKQRGQIVVSLNSSFGLYVVIHSVCWKYRILSSTLRVGQARPDSPPHGFRLRSRGRANDEVFTNMYHAVGELSKTCSAFAAFANQTLPTRMCTIRPWISCLRSGRVSTLRRVPHLGEAFQRQARVRNEHETSLLHEPVFRALPHPYHDGLHTTSGFLELSTPLAVGALSPSQEKQDTICNQTSRTESRHRPYRGKLTRRCCSKHPRPTLSLCCVRFLQGRLRRIRSVLIETVDR